MVEHTRAEGHTLWVAFLDITNVFLSTNQDMLWLKLYKMGICSKLFDWMCMLYSHMEYAVAMGGAHSNVFHSNIGVLIGDPVSSTFWDLFFADFKLHPDPDDILLFNIIMSHLEHTDDMAIVLYTPERLQHHLITFCCIQAPDWQRLLSFATIGHTVPTLHDRVCHMLPPLVAVGAANPRRPSLPPLLTTAPLLSLISVIQAAWPAIGKYRCGDLGAHGNI
jgi:hypothetical protein